MKYYEFIKDRYKNKEVHIVGSGASLLGFDYDKLKKETVIAVNHAYKFVKHDCCVFIDKNFVDRESPEVINSTICLSKFMPTHPEIIAFKTINSFTMDIQGGVCGKKSSGLAALTVALQGGARKVYLHGFDYCMYTKEMALEALRVNGKNESYLKYDNYLHATKGEVKHTYEKPEYEYVFTKAIEVFAQFPREKIINVSPYSAIPYFKKIKTGWPEKVEKKTYINLGIGE